MSNETNDGAPRTSKAGVAPDRDLKNYTSSPLGIPGWIQIPRPVFNDCVRKLPDCAHEQLPNIIFNPKETAK